MRLYLILIKNKYLLGLTTMLNLLKINVYFCEMINKDSRLKMLSHKNNTIYMNPHVFIAVYYFHLYKYYPQYI